MIPSPRSPWLGQVRLVQRPFLSAGMGSPQWAQTAPPEGVKPPAVGCVFIKTTGPAAPQGQSEMEIAYREGSIAYYEDIFRREGYSFVETSVPRYLEPGYDPNAIQKLNVIPAAGTSKHVWACPPAGQDVQTNPGGTSGQGVPVSVPPYSGLPDRASDLAPKESASDSAASKETKKATLIVGGLTVAGIMSYFALR